MYLYQFVCQVETYSDTAMRETALHETLEQFRTFFFGYADPVIYDLYTKLLLVFLNIYLNIIFPLEGVYLKALDRRL